jgi:membrane protease YdiL (CAAX protease family)
MAQGESASARPTGLRAQPPLGVALAILVGWLVVTFGGELLLTGGSVTSLRDLLSKQLVPVLLLNPVLLLVAVWLLNWWRATGLVGWNGARSLWFAAPLLLVAAAFAAVGATVVASGEASATTYLIVLTNALAVGLSEELMFRGILWHGISTRVRPVPTVLWTALAFGAVHVLNGVLTGSFAGSITQAVFVGMSGVYYGAVRLRTGSLWPGVVAHGLWDTGVTVSIGMAVLLVPLADLLLFLYGVVLLVQFARRPAAAATTSATRA